MVSDASDASLGRKYAAHLRKTHPERSITGHRRCIGPQIAKARQEQEQAVKRAADEKVQAVDRAFQKEAAKEAKHVMSLVDRQNQIYDMAMLGAKLALYKTDPVTKKSELRKDLDLRGLAGCLAQAVAITRLIHESDGMAKLQEKIDAIAEAMAKNE